MRSQRLVIWWAASSMLMLGGASVVSESAWSVVPAFMEETARVASPDSNLPLNGDVALDGDLLLAGSTVRRAGSSRHAAFLFVRRSATSWGYVTKLADVSGGAGSHLALDLSGNTAAVTTNDRTYVIELVNGAWRQTARIEKPETASTFGSSIAVTPEVLVVGGTAEARFVGYVYERAASGEWSFVTRLDAGATTTVIDARKPQLDVIANAGAPRVAIGSPNDGMAQSDPAGGNGSVYLFQRRDDGTWGPLQGVELIFGPEADPRAAGHVALGEDILAFSQGSPASVSVWEDMRSPSSPEWWVPWVTWPFTTASADALMNGKALSLAASGNRYVMGEPEDEDRGAKAGSVTMYDHQFGTRGMGYNEDPYVPKVELLASNARSGLKLGQDVSFSGNLVAASGDNDVYIFDLTRAHQPRDRIHEDFEDGAAQDWHPARSTWRVVAHNGFLVYRQTSTAGETQSVLRVGEWTNQAIHADLRPLTFNGANRWAGLVVRYVDEANYYAVRFRSNHTVEIVRRAKGATKTLASAAMTVSPNVNYRVRFEAIGSWLRVYVGGRRVLQVRDSGLKRGTVGFKTFWARAQYDNVHVSQNPAVVMQYDDFADGVLDEWQGQGQIVTANGNRVLRHTAAPGPIVRTVGGVEYNPGYLGLWDHVLECLVRVRTYGADGTGWFGLVSRADNHEFLDRGISVHINNGRISLRDGVGPTAPILASASLKLTPGQWYRLRIESIDDRHLVYIDGRHVLSGRDPDVDQTGARYGVISSNATVDVDNFLAQFP